MATATRSTTTRKVAKKTSGRARAKPVPAAPAEATESVAAAAPPAAPAIAPVAAPTGAKTKLVRDSFTIPKAEYEALHALKARLVGLARPTRKSEVLRAGILALGELSDHALVAAVGRVETLKTGRPKAATKKAAKPSNRKR